MPLRPARAHSFNQRGVFHKSKFQPQCLTDHEYQEWVLEALGWWLGKNFTRVATLNSRNSLQEFVRDTEFGLAPA